MLPGGVTEIFLLCCHSFCKALYSKSILLVDGLKNRDGGDYFGSDPPPFLVGFFHVSLDKRGWAGGRATGRGTLPTSCPHEHGMKWQPWNGEQELGSCHHHRLHSLLSSATTPVTLPKSRAWFQAA